MRLLPWRSWFPAVSLRRAEAYARNGQVRSWNVSAEKAHITAMVDGSDSEPYSVHLHFRVTAQSWRFQGSHCSCPVGLECKHAAAVLMVAEHELRSTSRSHRGASGASQKPSPPELPPGVSDWMARLKGLTHHRPVADVPVGKERLLYVLQPIPSIDPAAGRLRVEVRKVRLRADGSLGDSSWYGIAGLPHRALPRFATESDLRLARQLAPSSHRWSAEPIPLSGPMAAPLLREMVLTGRCHWVSPTAPPLRLTSPRPGHPAWRQDASGALRTVLVMTPPAGVILPITPPWFLDESTWECGPIAPESDLPDTALTTWLQAPAIPPEAAAGFRSEFLRSAAQLPFPEPPEPESPTEVDVPPVPHLHLGSTRLHWWDSTRGFSETGPEGVSILVATPTFRYGETGFPPAPGRVPTTVHHFDGQRMLVIRRQASAEQAWVEELMTGGLVKASEVLPATPHPPLADGWILQCPELEATQTFLRVTVPALVARGWQVHKAPDFDLEVLSPEAWFMETQEADAEAGNDWFSLQLGIVVAGERIDLLPVLLGALGQNAESLGLARLRSLAPEAIVPIELPDHRRLGLPAGRLRTILETLIELHSPHPLDAAGRLAVHRIRAADLGRLAEGQGGDPWEWVAPEPLRDLAQRLRQGSRGPRPLPPAEFTATLRPYQLEGLYWLQFLRESGLGGVLADDMGLGKTVQTIAHLALEKQHGRLDRPCLIVSPTSVLANWIDELARFAPGLRVLTLHGSDRHDRFSEVSRADVVLTTYPLLHRDAPRWADQEFHAVVLDEAQNIKNPRTQAAQAAATLRARHRLCLTGTPMENHLGELWSLFNFLVPGFLADETRFRALFRTPIEKRGDTQRRTHLAQRIRPLLLRRKKDEVAIDLPPKTEIVQRIELGPAQRDLYETVRLTMEHKVREAVDERGIARSHIVILDALLKLRQVCCDPSLVRLKAAAQVVDSAKLDALMEMLPTLLEDGRRVLVFSQFTTMLTRIEQRLAAAGIPWLSLTGGTRDRRTPVKRFQSGEVPLFLISLKAGGTGLNLTAADTVILYDPWWNPAVENQATDRAHRLGQDKPVFLYRLVAQGTVEERILELQARKQGLVEALLEEGAARGLRLESEDLEALLAPIR